MAKGLGQSVRAFRKELRDMRSDLDGDDEPRAASKPNQASTSAPGGPNAASSGNGDAPREDTKPQGGGNAAS
jgi:Sec-independent protein translocase protein TatA